MLNLLGHHRQRTCGIPADGAESLAERCVGARWEHFKQVTLDVGRVQSTRLFDDPFAVRGETHQLHSPIIG